MIDRREGLARPAGRVGILLDSGRLAGVRPASALDGNAQAASGAGDDPGSVVEVAGVEVGQLLLGDLADLLLGHLEALVLAALLGLLFRRNQLAALLLLDRDAGGLLEEHGGRRALDDELEAA